MKKLAFTFFISENREVHHQNHHFQKRKVLDFWKLKGNPLLWQTLVFISVFYGARKGGKVVEFSSTARELNCSFEFT